MANVFAFECPVETGNGLIGVDMVVLQGIVYFASDILAPPSTLLSTCLEMPVATSFSWVAMDTMRLLSTSLTIDASSIQRRSSSSERHSPSSIFS